MNKKNNYNEDNIFAKILNKDAKADVVLENDHVLCILDKYPRLPVHILVLPKGKFTDNRLSLRKNSKYFIGNRSIIVHDLKDDLGKGGDPESLKTGNAGPRLNCAKIKLI